MLTTLLLQDVELESLVVSPLGRAASVAQERIDIFFLARLHTSDVLVSLFTVTSRGVITQRGG